MCWACDNEKAGYVPTYSMATYPIGRIEQDYWQTGTYRIWVLAKEQRENLESIKFYRTLCQQHIDHYEQVVRVLESFVG